MAIIGAFMVPHPPIIVEEIGHRREKEIEKTIEGYREIARQIAVLKPETIIITTPHSIIYSDYFHISPGTSASGDFGQFGAKKVSLQVIYDTGFVNELTQVFEENDFSAGTLGQKNKNLDHGTMVPLYYINQEYKDYKLVRIGLSGQSFLAHYTLGQYIKETSEKLNRKVVIVASGDLSHKLTEDGPYGFSPKGPEYDEKIMEIMGKGDFLELFHFSNQLCQDAGECGHRSFLIMAGALDKTSVKPECLSYAGPYGVGYGICSYKIIGSDESRNFGELFLQEYRNEVLTKKSNEDEYVQLARFSLESFIISRKIIAVPGYLTKEMTEKQAGVFVSLKKNGELRGCIGTITPVRDVIAEEIIFNAVSAGVHDPRFNPVTEDELKDLVYSVDILGETEKIQSQDQLDVKKYGVIVTNGNRRGLLLPNLDGVDSVREQIDIAKRKAGISQNEAVEMERFEVVRHV